MWIGVLVRTILQKCWPSHYLFKHSRSLRCQIQVAKRDFYGEYHITVRGSVEDQPLLSPTSHVILIHKANGPHILLCWTDDDARSIERRKIGQMEQRVSVLVVNKIVYSSVHTCHQSTQVLTTTSSVYSAAGSKESGTSKSGERTHRQQDKSVDEGWLWFLLYCQRL